MAEETIETTESSSENKKSGKGPVFWFLVLIVVIAAAFLVYKTLPGSEGVAAVVNGEKITISQLELRYTAALESLKQNGLDPDNAEAVKEAKSKMLDSIIGENLFLQKAASEGINVSDADVDSFYNDTAQQLGSEEALANQLVQSGISKEKFREDIKKQLVARKYIDKISASEGASIEVTAQEAKVFYDDFKIQNTDAPPYETVETEIFNYLKQQKLNSLITSIIDSLKTEAKIEKFI